MSVATDLMFSTADPTSRTVIRMSSTIPIYSTELALLRDSNELAGRGVSPENRAAEVAAKLYANGVAAALAETRRRTEEHTLSRISEAAALVLGELHVRRQKALTKAATAEGSQPPNRTRSEHARAIDARAKELDPEAFSGDLTDILAAAVTMTQRARPGLFEALDGASK